MQVCNEKETDLYIFCIEEAFLSCRPLESFDFEEILKYSKHNNSVSAQEELLNSTICHPLNLVHPVKKDYQKNFLKRLIFQLEGCGEEVADSVYQEYVRRITGSSEPQEYFHRHFRIREQDFITLRESTSFVSNGTTGLSTWEGALALAEWCLHNTPLLVGRRLLELGCGVGLTGLAVSVACEPLSYTLTDSHPRVLSALEHNLALNQKLLSGTRVSVRLLDWEEPDSCKQAEPVDLVLAADVVFDQRLFPGLVNTLHHFLFAKPAQAILACTERNPDTITAFLQCLSEKGLSTEELPCPLAKTFHFTTNPPIRIFSCFHDYNFVNSDLCKQYLTH